MPSERRRKKAPDEVYTPILVLARVRRTRTQGGLYRVKSISGCQKKLWRKGSLYPKV